MDERIRTPVPNDQGSTHGTTEQQYGRRERACTVRSMGARHLERPSDDGTACPDRKPPAARENSGCCFTKDKRVRTPGRRTACPQARGSLPGRPARRNGQGRRGGRRRRGGRGTEPCRGGARRLDPAQPGRPAGARRARMQRLRATPGGGRSRTSPQCPGQRPLVEDTEQGFGAIHAAARHIAEVRTRFRAAAKQCRKLGLTETRAAFRAVRRHPSDGRANRNARPERSGINP
jgi:hypothetical protein